MLDNLMPSTYIVKYNVEKCMADTDDETKDKVKAAAGTKGGRARAEVLSSDERSEIASAAAKARWGEVPEAAYGSPDRPLRIAGIDIPCYVLGDGRRVIVQAGMLKSLDISQGTAGRGAGDRLTRLAATKGLSPFINKNLADMIMHPIRFRTPRGGGYAYGYEATVLADLCEAVLAARKAETLNYQQDHIAEQCEILLRSFAKVGIIALVDEATGYQAIRPQDALEKYLEKILRKELAAWAKKFPDEFYENIYKLKNWPWPGMSKNRYSVVAHYTRDLVYDRIAPGLLKALEARSPKNERGVRPNKLHQWLNDLGDPMLAQHLHSLIMFQRLAIRSGYGWNRFVGMVDQVLPKKGATLLLPFRDQDE
jgi:hypothetical protein